MGAIIACPSREAYPSANRGGEWAERGHELHEFARLMVENPAAREDHLLKVSEEYRATAEGMNVAAALEGIDVLRTEPAYIVDVKKKTARYLGSNINRAYGELKKYEIPLSIDVEANFLGTPVELDYKSGMYIGSVEDHWQRRICAMALMLYHNAPSCISRVAYIKDDGSIEPDGAEFMSMEIDEWCDILVRAIDAVEVAKEQFRRGVMPPVTPGEEQCKYCQALRSCPYWTNFVKSMNGRLESVALGPELSVITDEELGAAWILAKAAVKRAEEIIEGIKLIASVRPILIDAENLIAPKMQPRTYFDQNRARGLLRTTLQQNGLTDEQIDSKLRDLNRTRHSPTTKIRKR